MTLRLPRAVLFDWDNTLVDNWGCVAAAMNAALDSFGMAAWSEQEVRDRARLSMRDSFPALFGPDWQQASDIFYAHFANHHLAHLKAMPGADSLLDALRDQHIYLGVVSNKTGRFLRAEAAALGWTHHFGSLVGAGDAAHDKPARDPVDLALNGTGIAAGPEVWFVGDADVDLQIAHVTGCVPVLLGTGDLDCGTFPPVYTYENCDFLLSLVRSMVPPIFLGNVAEPR